MTILGIDYGRKRLGLATCGIMKIAHPAGMIERSDVTRDLQKLKEKVEEHEIEKIVIGYPKNMNNSAGEMAQEAEKFGEMLQQELQLPVEFWDERLTTRQADRAMIDAGMSRGKRKKTRDQVAAALLLQSYADCKL